MALTVMNVVFVLLLSLFTLGKVKQVLFEFLKCLSQEFFLLTHQEELFKVMKNAIYFIEVAFLVVKLFMVSIFHTLE